MSHRLPATARPLLAIATLIASLVMLMSSAASAVQSDRGLIDETSYQSPQFGYGVTWTESWTTRDRDVITNPGGFDTITLRGDDGTVRISGRADTYDPLTFLQDTIAIQLASGGELIDQDTTGGVPTAELLIGREKMRIDVLSLPDAGAIVLVSLRAGESDFDAAFASAQEGIQINGAAPFDAAAATTVIADEAPPVEETDTVAPAPQVTEPTVDVLQPTQPAEPVSTQEVLGGGVQGSAYTSPSFGFSVSWDPAIWSVPDDAEYSEPNYDALSLESVTGPLTVSGWNAYDGDAAACLIGEETYYNTPESGISEWQPAVDAEGNELTGETETSAWGVFTSIFTNPDDPNAPSIPYVDFIECHSLGDGASVVIFHSFAERDVYNEHIGSVLAVVESLELRAPATAPPPATVDAPPQPATPELPGATVTAEPPSSTLEPAPATPTPVSGGETPSIDAGDGEDVTGQAHGYSFSVPPDWQVNDSSLGSNPEVTSLTNGTSTVTIQARAMTAATLSDCVANIAGEDEAQPVYTDLALSTTASGDPFAGEDDFTAFANFTFTGPDGETWAHFIECRWIVERQSVLIVTQDVPQELFGSERGARRQIQNSIEIGG